MFKKDDSLALKGIAILMMMWHHNFLADRIKDYHVIFSPLSEGFGINIATFFKICVSVFAFISGYGLYLSLKNSPSDSNSDQISKTRSWLRFRLIKGLSGYWFVILLSWVICSIIAIPPYPAQKYFNYRPESIFVGIWYMIMDFFGLSTLVGLSPFNGTWWYMSASIVYICLAPVVYSALKKYGSVLTVSACYIIPRLFLQTAPTNIVGFFPAFLFGMVFAHEKLFDRWHDWTPIRDDSRRSEAVKFLSLVILCPCLFRLYLYLPSNLFTDVRWGMIPLPFILFCVSYLDRIPGLRQVLGFLGKHSANVFLVHTFLRHYYAADFIYGFKFAYLIVIVLLALSILISIALEALKKLLHYEQFINRLAAPKKN